MNMLSWREGLARSTSAVLRRPDKVLKPTIHIKKITIHTSAIFSSKRLNVACVEVAIERKEERIHWKLEWKT
jgi:hypothetical protein